MTTEDTPQGDGLVIERTFEATPRVIWRLWTEPEHVEAWYGPHGAAISVLEMDVRVGGRRRVCMEVETPNGPQRMWFTGEFVEVVETRRLVYSESMSDEHGNILSPTDLGMPDGHPETTYVTVELEDLGGRTRMVMAHAGVPSDSPGAAGWTMAFDDLETYLRQRAA